MVCSTRVVLRPFSCNRIATLICGCLWAGSRVKSPANMHGTPKDMRQKGPQAKQVQGALPKGHGIRYMTKSCSQNENALFTPMTVRSKCLHVVNMLFVNGFTELFSSTSETKECI